MKYESKKSEMEVRVEAMKAWKKKSEWFPLKNRNFSLCLFFLSLFPHQHRNFSVKR